MASSRDIKKRIKGVKNIQQITRTMEMVAAAKLRRAQIAAKNAKPYADKLNAMMHNIGASVGNIQHPLLKDRPVKKAALVVVSSNKGLCGAFNPNVMRRVEEYIKKHPDVEYSIFCVGKKGKDFFSRRGYNVVKSFLPSEKELELSLVIELAGHLSKGFENEDYDQVQVFYSRFVSPMIQRPTSLTVIPFTKPEETEEEEEEREKSEAVANSDYLFEPEPEELMWELIPKYIEFQLYNAMAQSQAGEHASRLIAMKNATDNAKDVIKSLTMSYNKARQAAITKEILEIVSGAEAIKAE